MTGIYIHVPFCASKCYYCDFYSVLKEEYVEAYFERLYKEIKTYSEFGKIEADTVFFGGGTPSSVNEKYIAKTIEVLNSVFDIKKDSEITVELNPKTFDKTKLMCYKKSGVNRLSMGLQSANDDELIKMGRIHTKSDFDNAYMLIRDCGFENVNTDIIYGLMDSDIDKLSKTAEYIKSLNCEHISAYALTLSENTPIYKMNYSYPEDDEVYNQYKFLCSYFSDYRHYEISNFSKKICRHNMKYWDLSPYIGFGAAAYSFFKNKRYSNVRSIEAYIKNENVTDEMIYQSEIDMLNDCIMLSLRTDEGLDINKIKNIYGYDILKEKGKYIAFLMKNNFLKETEKGFSLTEDGFFVSNTIISDLLIDK